ncbi:hypothetical protein [Mucilaginibacter sp.]
MTNLFPALYCTAALCMAVCSVKAQSAAGNPASGLPPGGIIVDGNLHEWGDTLQHYNADTQIGYAINNDHNFIYIAARVGERSEQMRVLANGLTVSINTKGKKKDTYSITFPLGNENPLQRPANAARQESEHPDGEDREEMMQARLTALRNIRVTGFKDVESEIITTANTYGFKTAMSYDSQGYLLYEAAIPLKFFEHEDLNKTEWAFNFKVNGFKAPAGNKGAGGEDMPGSSMGRGGMGGGMNGGGMGRGGGMRGGGMRGGGMNRGGGGFNRGETAKSVDFWDKFYLHS